MLIDYWLVSQLGRVWLWARPGLRERLGDMPRVCHALASGDGIPAGLTWRAQEFAFRVWFRFGLSACITAVLLGVVVALLPSQTARNWAIGIPVAVGGLMFVAGGQMSWLRFRADRTRTCLGQAGTAGCEPLPHDSMGRPRRLDFWVVTAIAAVVYGLLGYAGLR